MTAAIPRDVTAVAWHLLIATGAGAITGVIVGGVGGRWPRRRHGSRLFRRPSVLPRRGRSLLWATVVGLVIGADLLKPQSLDFTLLDPKSFAVASFILIPGVAALLIALTLERLLMLEPWCPSPILFGRRFQDGCELRRCQRRRRYA